jgi:GNAT superfamily N-acetyltransferase
MRADDFLNEGGLRSWLMKLGKDTFDYAAGQAPKVKNFIDQPKGGSFGGRVPASPEEATHVYRNMSPDELEAARKSGYFEKNPNPGKTDWDTDKKYWSQGDTEGYFGRSWKDSPDNAQVRLPQEKLPRWTAGKTGDAEVLDKTTGTWNPVKENAVNESREEFEGMTIEMIKNGHVLVIHALDDWGNNVLGSVVFNIGDNNDLDPQDLKVDERYQGQGIARAMYDYAKSKGYTIHRSYDQSDAGAGFWNKHRGEDVRVWENLEEKINQDIATQGWRAEKTITLPDVGELYLRARNTSHITPPQFIVDVATPDGKNVGYFRFLVMDWEKPKTGWFATKSKKDPYVMGGNVSVWNDYQKKGIARAVYQWVKSLGNDVRPSTTQTDAGKAMWRSFGNDPLGENFADGKNPGRKGLSKRMGVNTKASVSDLRKTAKNSSGEKQRMAHWLANMKSGRNKNK